MEALHLSRAQVVSFTQIAMSSPVNAAFEIYEKDQANAVHLRVIGEYGEYHYKLSENGGFVTTSAPPKPEITELEPDDDGTGLV